MPDIYKFSESFQLKILALMARDKSTFISYREVLQPRYFKKDLHIDLARIITEYYDAEIQRNKAKKTPVNPPTVEVLFEEVRKLVSKSTTKSKLKGQYEDLVLDIMDLDLSDSEYVRENMIAFGKRAALEHAILDSVDEIEKGTEDFSGVEDRIAKAIRVGEDIGDLGTDYYEDAEDRMKVYTTGTDGVRRIPTGMTGLDKIMHGGLGDGELGVIIAPPNRGKQRVA